MLKKHKYILFCSTPDNLEVVTASRRNNNGFFIYKMKGHIIIIPKIFDGSIINPRNVLNLKKELGLQNILIIDRIKGSNEIISIKDHVNRSGQNFLRSVTPEVEFPQFPDMSKIYHKINGFKTVAVHTIGEDRFKNPPLEKDIIWSELIGLIAPVFHYVGIKIFALGSKDPENIVKLL